MIVVTRNVFCDRCSRWHDCETGLTAAQARASARLAGWRRVRNAAGKLEDVRRGCRLGANA